MKGSSAEMQARRQQTVVYKLKKGTSSYGQKISSLILYRYCYSETELPIYTS